MNLCVKNVLVLLLIFPLFYGIKSFNMGVGLVMIVDKDEAQGLVDYINNRHPTWDIF